MEQRGAHQVGEAGDHRARRVGVGVDDRRDGVEGVEQKVRVEMRVERKRSAVCAAERRERTAQTAQMPSQSIRRGTGRDGGMQRCVGAG
jgi:hypothetical protein